MFIFICYEWYNGLFHSYLCVELPVSVGLIHHTANWTGHRQSLFLASTRSHLLLASHPGFLDHSSSFANEAERLSFKWHLRCFLRGAR